MPGKGNPLLSVRIPPDLDNLIDSQVEQTGESRSEITIAALSAYLQPSSPDDELSSVKRQLSSLETIVKGIQKHFG